MLFALLITGETMVKGQPGGRKGQKYLAIL
jgi:hypothetical protein